MMHCESSGIMIRVTTLVRMRKHDLDPVFVEELRDRLGQLRQMVRRFLIRILKTFSPCPRNPCQVKCSLQLLEASFAIRVWRTKAVPPTVSLIARSAVSNIDEMGTAETR